jgi:putative ABC transport system permease protein
MERLRQDLQFGVRMLLRQRGFTLAALAILALGIGSNVVVFSLARTMFFKRLHVADADRLIVMAATHVNGDGSLPMSLTEYRYVRDHARTLSEVAAHYSNAPLNLVDNSDSREINGSVVTGSFFPLLRLTPALGRFFLPNEDAAPGRDAVAVISYRLWQREFAADAGVLGRSIRLNGTAFTIVGVAPRGFDGVTEGGLATEVWMPSAMFRVGYRYCDASTDPACTIVRVVGRLAPGVAVRDARAEVEGLASQLAIADPEHNRERRIRVAPLQGAAPELGADEARVPILLAASVAAVLLVACANLAGLLLARGLTRTREFGIRPAPDRKSTRVRQLLTESLLLGVLGGGLGLLLAIWTKDLLGGFYAFNVEGQRANFTLEIDRAAVLFAACISVLTVLVFGLVPALQATRRDVVPALKNGASGARASSLRGALVITQITVCIALLVGASLLLRSVSSIYRGPGFNPDASCCPGLRPSLVAQTPGRAEAFQREVIQRLQRLPGVVAASPAQFPPLPGWGGQSPAWLPGQQPPPGQTGFRTFVNAVGPDYLRTLQLPLLTGRDFTDRDRKGAPRVAIVNETVARTLWPSGDAVGSEFVIAGDSYRVIGVAAAAQYHAAGAPADPLVFVDYWQQDAVGTTAIDSRTHVRVAGDAARMLPIVKREIMSVDPTVPISEDRPLTEWLGYFFRPVRATAAAVAFFAALALFLSVAGLYAVVSTAVAQRTREIAVRMALGAARRDVGLLVLRQGLRLTMAGIATGIGAALAGGRLLGAYLYGVGTHDAAAIGAAVCVLGLMSLVASYLPARRAMGVEPMRALRQD